jgi:excisionase family DNA binding protein
MGDRIALGTAARLLNVSRAAVYRMVERGELRRKRGPLGWEYSRAEVQALAEQRAQRYQLPYQRGGRRLRREVAGA